MKFCRKSGVVDSFLNQEYSLLLPGSDFLIHLNEVGSVIWDSLKKPLSLIEIVDYLALQYDVERLQLKEDAEDFLKRMIDSGVVKRLE